MPITMDRRDTSLTVAEPLGMLEAGRKKTRYFPYPRDIYVLANACTADYSGSGWPAYCRSKLGNLWQVTWLARRYPEQTFVAVHPGVFATGLEGPTTGLGGAFKRGMFLSPELGAQASLIAATQPGVHTGSSFHNVHGWMTLSADDAAREPVGRQNLSEEIESLVAPHLPQPIASVESS